MRTPWDTLNGPSYIEKYSKLYTPEMRTPPLIRVLKVVPRVFGIEGFLCTFVDVI